MSDAIRLEGSPSRFGGGESVGRREQGWTLAGGTLLFRAAGQSTEIWLRKTGWLGAYLPGADFEFVRDLIEAWRAGQLRLSLEPPLAAREGEEPPRRSQRGPLKA